MQRYTIYLFLWKALHVSRVSSAHHQELKTVYTASCTLSNLYCYLPLSWKRWNSLFISSTTVVAVKVWQSTQCSIHGIQIWAPDDGRRNGLKQVQLFTEINKLCNVASCWLYLKILWRCTDPWTSKWAIRFKKIIYLPRKSCKHVLIYTYVYDKLWLVQATISQSLVWLSLQLLLLCPCLR